MNFGVAVAVAESYRALLSEVTSVEIGPETGWYVACMFNQRYNTKTLLMAPLCLKQAYMVVRNLVFQVLSVSLAEKQECMCATLRQ